MGRESRINTQRREALMREWRQRMFLPVIDEKGVVQYVNPSNADRITRGDELSVDEHGTAPDGNPWPTSRMFFIGGNFMVCRGTPEMILRSWFGGPANEDKPKIVTVPPGARIIS
jgi:hypothetical protein